MLCTTSGIALAHITEPRVELGALGVLAEGLVGGKIAHPRTFQLSTRVLIEGADADVADALPVHAASKGNVYG